MRSPRSAAFASAETLRKTRSSTTPRCAICKLFRKRPEATQSLPDALKAEFPAIPWRQISGFRNILVHNYLGNIDPLTVSTVVVQHLDPLEASVKSMLGQSGSFDLQ